MTRRGVGTREKSSLSQSMSAGAIDEVSDSGYSTSTPPKNESPPPHKSEPAQPPMTRKETLRRGATPAMGRSSSKSVSRSGTPAAPRNIPGAKPRERSPTVTSTGGADECDCSDCKKGAKSSPSASSPSVLAHGAWPQHQHSSSYHGSYGQSPQWATDFSYPLRYDGYGPPPESGMSGSLKSSESKRKDRSSMPMPPRPSSTFSAAVASSSYSAGFSGGYFPPTSPAPQAPAPSSTCPPTSSYIYPPPPASPAYASSPYAPPPLSIPPYGYSNPPEPWPMTPSTPGSGYPANEYSVPPLPNPMNRRNSLRGVPPAPFPEEDYYPRPPQRRSNRGPSQSSQERPVSWSSTQFAEAAHRSMSVPPQEAYPPPPADPTRRKVSATPGPSSMRRRESGHSSQGSASFHSSRLGPSALSRAMESCAIDDDPLPPQRSHSRSHSHPVHHYSDPYNPHSGQLARRDYHQQSGAMVPASQHQQQEREEFVQLTVPDSDEPLTMRYPAGIPVKLHVNGERVHFSRGAGDRERDAGGEREKRRSATTESNDLNVAAYRYVQQRQQQVHAQLQYGAAHAHLEDSPPPRNRNSGEYVYGRAPPSGGSYGRRAAVNGI